MIHSYDIESALGKVVRHDEHVVIVRATGHAVESDYDFLSSIVDDWLAALSLSNIQNDLPFDLIINVMSLIVNFVWVFALNPEAI